jgi:uncharacterized membrane protein YeiH
LIGYVGDVAFTLGGCITAKRIGLGMGIQFWSGISTFCFGGAFIRDCLLLRRLPSILGSPREVALIAIITVIAIIVLNHVPKLQSSVAFDVVLCILDSIGISAFAGYGFMCGIEANASCLVSVLTAFSTACGGGIISTIIRAFAKNETKHLKETFAANLKGYYPFGIIMSVAYAVCYYLNEYNNANICYLTIIAIVIGLIVARDNLARGRRRP